MAKLRQVKYDISARGIAREDELRGELDSLLHLGSVACAKRRRSQTVDESDFEQGFREIVGRRQVDLARQIISTILYLVAGGCASWAVNVFTGTNQSAGQGYWAIIAMAACGALGGFIQFWRS